jgi:hypothetical protein
VHVDSRLHCSDIATHSLLGGQHGEEGKVEDEVCGEENREEDEAQDGEAEVRLRFEAPASKAVDDFL